MCSVELILLEWGFDIQLSGHSYKSMEEWSPEAGLIASGLEEGAQGRAKPS